MVKYTTRIGKSASITYEGEDLKGAFKFGAVVGSFPLKCDACGSEELHLTFKNPKENDYYGIRCRACGSELMLHQKKTGGFYLKQGEKMTVYVAPASDGAATQTTAEPTSEVTPF